MKHRKRSVMILAGFGCMLGSILFIIKNANLETTSPNRSEELSLAEKPERSSFAKSEAMRRTRRTVNRTSKVRNEGFIREWEMATHSHHGIELNEIHTRIVTSAISELSGMELAHFIDFVISTGQFENFRSYLVGGCIVVFAQEREDDAFRWFKSIENPVIQAVMGRSVGAAYHGGRFESHYSTFSGLPTVQKEMLLGHCSTLNPVDAFNEYIKLKPTGADFSDLKRLAATIDSNFEQVSALLPADSKSIAFDVRNSLIAQWASISPSEAVNFVMTNPQTVSPKQIDAVISSWMKSNSKEAMAWVESAPYGPYQDQGYRSLTEQLKSADPSQAWLMVAKSPNMELRTELLGQILSEWRKIDPSAAETAKTELAAVDVH